jgi:dienelactone hydrolase
MLAPSAAAAPRQVLYVGDSLGVGTTPLLARELGSSANVHGDSRIGRPSPEGLRVLQSSIGGGDDTVVFDLGTNDDPARPATLASDLAAARRASGDRCLIVATLNRPPLNGISVDGLNQAVLAFASASRNVQLVDWNAIAQSQPDILEPDHVHPTPQGFAMRAQLFAQAVVACSAPPPDQGDSLVPPPPAPKKAKPKRRKRPQIKVPGIESSGISFTEPVRFRGLDGQLLLPNTKPPYPAVVMIGGAQKQAEFMAAHGIAVLTYRERGSAEDARAAVALLAKRDEIRHSGIAVWAFGAAGDRAAEAAAGNAQVAAVAVVSPDALPDAEARDWRARRDTGSPAITAWLRVRSGDSDPSSAWRRVSQPVLAIWGTRDDRMPIRASAEELKRALGAGGNRDRTFRWFKAGHDVAAPGMLEETARWLGLRLGERRARPVIADNLPPANPGPDPENVSDASALYALPLQAIWLLAPALMLLVVLLRRAPGVPSISPAAVATARISAAALVAGIACAASIGTGIHLALGGEGAGWPFILGFVLAAVLGACSIAAARHRAWLTAIACDIWLALALFWLL